MSSNDVETPLGQGAGYGVVLGLGFAFAIGMIGTTFALKRFVLEHYAGLYHLKLTVIRYQNEVQTSEMFSTAGRTVKTGLVAAAVVSSWTWCVTILNY
jgi:hypothetical protein